MSRSTVISIDAMGGDRGPASVLEGMGQALAANPQISFIVHGDESELNRLLQRHPALGARCDVRHAAQIISMSEKPSRALRDGRDSSMWHALDAVAKGEAKVAVSCGNTGALMAMAIFVLRKAPGIDRPAIAVNWPSTAPHGFNTMLDMGADVRADPRNLLQFAVMGAEYAHLRFGIERPRVGLLNVGTEPSKGPQELREAGLLLEAAANDRFAYVGFVEGTDITKTTADVIVTDGFTGNVALKAAEGTASFISRTLRDSFQHSVWSRIGGLFAMSSLQRLRQRIDPRRVNGGVFLGLNGAVVKSHGGADAVGFRSAIKLAIKMAESDFPLLVAAELAKVGAGEPRQVSEQKRDGAAAPAAAPSPDTDDGPADQEG
ncbi:MAG TPA: phosphate acyltransferase PlsX [Thermohalobaculum sp.]|nr:phosphate acyltransferase PlsX [Thermohalobaculum sp.]